MPRLTNDQLKAILQAEKTNSLASAQSSKLTADRERALAYYNGQVDDALPVPDGRSKAVSMDVLDTIEGLMPSLMEIFAGSEDVVEFDPVGAEDAEAAEQESDYVNHVFMKQNDGFQILYNFIKDALLSKTGIVKVYWDQYEEIKHETYIGLTEEQLIILVQDQSITITEHTAHDDGFGMQLHDVKIETKRDSGCARVASVAPEEFGISRRATTMADADYCFHEVVKTESELIADGYPADVIRRLPSYSDANKQEDFNRDTVEERGITRSDDLNKANRTLRITEHYIKLDLEQSGKAALYLVTTGGEEGEIISRRGEDEVVEIDFMPFAAMTPVIMPHRFFGRSIADLVIDIQNIKTVLLRSLLDNAYLANNPRLEVPESHASPNTIPDALVSRPGGIIRTKNPGGLNPIRHPDIGSHVYPLLEYQDATREWRTGVTRQGQGIDADALQNQSATAVQHVYNAAQARMKLIARIFAETGIKEMFLLLHAVIRRHGQQQQTARLRNKWVTVNPRDWKERSDLTVNVGLGTGGKTERVAHLMALINLQKEAVAAGLVQLVSPKNLYSSAKELCKLLDLKNVDAFFTDPNSPEGQQAAQMQAQRPDPKIAEMQAKADIEKLQAEADIQTQRDKATSEIALAERKYELEERMALLEFKLKADLHKLDMDKKYADMFSSAVSDNGNGDGGDANGNGAPRTINLLTDVFAEIRDLLDSPSEIVRDQNGKATGVRKVRRQAH